MKFSAATKAFKGARVPTGCQVDHRGADNSYALKASQTHRQTFLHKPLAKMSEEHHHHHKSSSSNEETDDYSKVACVPATTAHLACLTTRRQWC